MDSISKSSFSEDVATLVARDTFGDVAIEAFKELTDG